MVLNMETNPTEICDKSKQLLNRSKCCDATKVAKHYVMNRFSPSPRRKMLAKLKQDTGSENFNGEPIVE